ncbi:O-methyltransferase-domain-containing protein [Mycena rosella]|uniref:O-methyltransferase-domain-containing protein n=1 Tax=Mycena rosella TaxID=1033263 RepID=A0AAD7CD31_MYCRO|nr:O-methyltransferase-domain-containing protein [Mycena rosella]
MSDSIEANRAVITTSYAAHRELWARADRYHNEFLLKPDATLDAVLQNTKDKIKDYEIAVSPALGKFLHLLLRSIGAKRVLEVGSLGGYSAIWMARALPDSDGEVVALELDELHARVIEENVKTAGLSSKVKVIVGPAYASLLAMHPSESTPKFDLVFIDADKKSNARSSTTSDTLGTPRILRTQLASREGIRALLKYIKDDAKVEATTVHTVGRRTLMAFFMRF